MKVVDILKFDHFVSFVADDDGDEVKIQYRADQVWEDDRRVWHVAQDAAPLHVSRKSAPGQECELSPSADCFEKA